MSPLWAAGMTPGRTGASARNKVSITVGKAMLHKPSAAGGRALSMVPTGEISLSGRKQPSLTGARGMVSILKATRAADRPPE